MLFRSLVLFGLYSKKINWKSALAGMLVGTITVIIWKMTGLGDILYEIVPGFFFNALTIVIMDHFIQPEPDVVADFEKMVETIKEKS